MKIRLLVNCHNISAGFDGTTKNAVCAEENDFVWQIYPSFENLPDRRVDSDRNGLGEHVFP